VPVKQEGRLVTFHARYMQKKPPGDIKKVRYPKGSKTSRMLFNIDRAKHQSRIVICEDVFSAMAVGREGVGTFGTSISKYQLALLLGSAADEIVLMWDPDAIDKAYEEAERLSEHWTVRVVELRGNRDPDEYSKADLARILAQAKASRGSRLFARRVRARLRSISI
jgi:DNA primase